MQQTAHKNHAKRSAKAGPEKHISPPRVLVEPMTHWSKIKGSAATAKKRISNEPITISFNAHVRQDGERAPCFTCQKNVFKNTLRP